MEDNKIKGKRPKIEKPVEEDQYLVNVVDPNTGQEKQLINCLRNEKVTVRFIIKQRGLVDDPKSPYYGGMAETSVHVYSVPKLTRSDTFINVLTKNEMEYLEYIMGLPKGVFNVYNRTNNYWSSNNSQSVHNVRLTKRDTILDLSIPEDYIRYKILLAQTEVICPDLQTLEDYPKPTYKFVLIRENAEAKNMGRKIDIKMDCYEKLIEYKNNESILRAVIEICEGKQLAHNIKIEFLRTKAHDLVESNAKLMYSILNDNLLTFKALIKEATINNILSNRNNFFYLKENGQALCEENEDPTLNNAAKYLANPKNQDLYFSIQAQLK